MDNIQKIIVVFIVLILANTVEAINLNFSDDTWNSCPIVDWTSFGGEAGCGNELYNWSINTSAECGGGITGNCLHKYADYPDNDGDIRSDTFYFPYNSAKLRIKWKVVGGNWNPSVHVNIGCGCAYDYFLPTSAGTWNINTYDISCNASYACLSLSNYDSPNGHVYIEYIELLDENDTVLPTNSSPPSPHYGIDGYVKDYYSGTGIDEANVHFCKVGGSNFCPLCQQQNGCSKIYEIETDATGYYNLTIEAGVYEIIAEKDETYGRTLIEEDFASTNETMNISMVEWSQNISVVVQYNLTDYIETAYVKYTDYDDEDTYVDGFTNSTGGVEILLPYGGLWNYSVSRTGYETKTGQINHSYAYRVDLSNNEYFANRIFYMFPTETYLVRQGFHTYDHLTLENLENVTITGKEWSGSYATSTGNPELFITSTDAVGLADVNIDSGEYLFEFYLDTYDSVWWYKNVINDSTLGVAMIKNFGNLTKYNVTVWTQIDGINQSYPFQLHCTYINGDEETWDYVTNASGGYLFDELIPDQSVCEGRIWEDDIKVVSHRFTVEDNYEFTLEYDSLLEVSFYIADGLTWNRILGSHITIYQCNTTCGDCTYITRLLDNEPDVLPSQLLENGSCINATVRRSNYITYEHTFTVRPDNLTQVIVMSPWNVIENCYQGVIPIPTQLVDYNQLGINYSIFTLQTDKLQCDNNSCAVSETKSYQQVCTYLDLSENANFMNDDYESGDWCGFDVPMDCNESYNIFITSEHYYQSESFTIHTDGFNVWYVYMDAQNEYIRYTPEYNQTFASTSDDLESYFVINYMWTIFRLGIIMIVFFLMGGMLKVLPNYRGG